MPILSFSVKKDELLDHTKTDTTRVFTAHRWRELSNAKLRRSPLYLWWKPRTKEKAHLFDSEVHGLWVVGFIEDGGGLWPFWGHVPNIQAEVLEFVPERPPCFGRCYELSSACSACNSYNPCRRAST